MLREEQIDLRRQRARAGKFQIENLGKNRVFSDYRVTNPDSGGQYTVAVRGFDVGDNTCTCPDYKSNTLGTCKHIEAVIEHLQADLPAHLQKKKAAVTRPEIFLHYGEQLQLGIHLPPRHSDKLARLAAAYFDAKGLWSGKGKYRDLIRDVESIPEAITFFTDAMEFVSVEIERGEMFAREQVWLEQLESGTLDLNLLAVPLYDYQTRGALFLACRGRSILGDDMGLGKTVQTLAAIELLARERGVQRVLVVAPASVKYQWEGGNQEVHATAGPGDRGRAGRSPRPLRRAHVLPAGQLRAGRARPRGRQRLEAGRHRPRRGPAHQELGSRRRAGK